MCYDMAHPSRCVMWGGHPTSCSRPRTACTFLASWLPQDVHSASSCSLFHSAEPACAPDTKNPCHHQVSTNKSGTGEVTIGRPNPPTPTPHPPPLPPPAPLPQAVLPFTHVRGFVHNDLGTEATWRCYQRTRLVCGLVGVKQKDEQAVTHWEVVLAVVDRERGPASRMVPTHQDTSIHIHTHAHPYTASAHKNQHCT
jgi:hypothetical protein